MYSGRQKTVNLPPLQLIALLFGVGLFLLLLILAGKIAFERARESTSGLAGGLTHGADREIGSGDASGEVRGLAHRNGAASGQPSSATQTTPFALPTITFGGNANKAVFASPAQQQAAQESLAPLHELLENVRRFDTTVLSGAATDGSGISGQAQTGGAAATSFDVPVLLDSLEAQTALVAHPYRFPEPLQDDAAQATREVYIYLETVRGSGLGQMKPSSDDPLVRATAQKHLEKGALIVARMDALAQGGTNPGDGGIAAAGYISPLP